MQMIYNSPVYCVMEIAGSDGAPRGVEILDKLSRREIYLEGLLAETFRSGVAQIVSGSPTVEALDHFISQYEGLMQQPLALH
jgi:predicted metal-dependent peptidase